MKLALKLSCLSDEGASLDGFSQLSVSFSSETGVVLTFLLTFCVKTKSKSGFGAEAPIKQNSFLLMHYGLMSYNFEPCTLQSPSKTPFPISFSFWRTNGQRKLKYQKDDIGWERDLGRGLI